MTPHIVTPLMMTGSTLRASSAIAAGDRRKADFVAAGPKILPANQIELEDDTDGWRTLSDLRDNEDPAFAGANVTGHLIMERAAIEHEIETTGFDGAYDALSSGQEQRVRALRQLIGRSLFRRHLVGDAALLDRVEALDETAPNFAAVTRLVRDAVHVSKVGGAPLRLPPLLIVGPAGIGKSRYVRALANALETWVEEVSGSTLSDPLALTGHDVSWRAASKGRVAGALLASPTSAPLIFVDECEKVSSWDGKAFPLDGLLPLLEPHTAQRFTDDYLKAPMRADRVIWLFACNAVNGLSAPFLSRVLVVFIDDMGAGGRTQVLRAIFDEASRTLAVSMQLSEDGALNPVRDLSLRRVRIAFEIAIARAVSSDRRFVTGNDLASAVALLGRSSERSPFGFVAVSHNTCD